MLLFDSLYHFPSLIAPPLKVSTNSSEIDPIFLAVLELDRIRLNGARDALIRTIKFFSHALL